MRHHHCGDTSGSIREWQRAHVPTEWRYGSRFSSRPRSSSQTMILLSTAFWSSSSKPSASIRPSRPITVSVSRPCAAPISKSVGS